MSKLLEIGEFTEFLPNTPVLISGANELSNPTSSGNKSMNWLVFGVVMVVCAIIIFEINERSKSIEKIGKYR